MPGLNREQCEFIANWVEQAISACTKGDRREHEFVLITLTREDHAKDGNDKVTFNTVSRFPREVVTQVVADWLSMNRH